MTTPPLARIAAVIRLEWRTQRREPLTVLYMLVLAALAAAFTADGPVELVRARGGIPRQAPWAVMLASTALTAFGQVITTMVAATVVLRDAADRVDGLLAVTPLTVIEYRIGKLVAALGTLLLIYTAIPLGLIAGSVVAGGSLEPALGAALLPFVVVVVPTMLSVGALQFAIGVLSGRLWVVVGQGLVLIWLWSAAVGAVESGAGGLLVTLADPFSSAPLLSATSGWSDADRLRTAMPVTSLLLGNRALWLLVSAGAAWLAIVAPERITRRAAPRDAERRAEAPVRRAAALARAPGTAPWRRLVSTLQYTLRWMVRDAGWRVLTVLGAVNVVVHVWRDAALAPSSAAVTAVVLADIGEHARLFLILLATIYAGELVWRERDERSAAQFDGAPIATWALVGGRVGGVVVAQGLVVGVLASSAGVAASLSSGHVASVLPLCLGLGVRVALPFVVWMLLGLAVQVIVRQKVAAHLLLIAAWMVFATQGDGATATADVRVPVVVWVAVGGTSLLVAGLGWWRGEGDRCWRRRRPVVSGTERQ